MDIDYKILTSEDYQKYMKGLALYSFQYVESVRRKFAVKAWEMYQNETVRKLVIAYGEEYTAREQSYIRDFCFAVEHYEPEKIQELNEAHFGTSCLNRAHSYGDTIKFFFGI